MVTSGASLYSGGGNISIKGKNKADVADNWIGAVRIDQNTKINSGAGEIYIEGDSTANTVSNAYYYGAGVILSYGGTTKSMLTSAGGTATESAIRIVGRGGTNENGIDSYYSGTRGSVVIESLGTGKIDLEGTTTHNSWYGVNLGGAAILSKAGDITINGGANGVQFNNWNQVTAYGNLGACPTGTTPTNCNGTDTATSTAANIYIKGGRYSGATDNARQVIHTTGKYLVTPVGDEEQFSGAMSHYGVVSGPASEIRFGNDLGNVTYLQAMNVFGTYTSAGNIETYGGATEVNGTFTAGGGFRMIGAALTTVGTVTSVSATQLSGASLTANANFTVTGEGSDLIFETKGDIATSDSKTFTTNKGDIILWADTDSISTAGGAIDIGNGGVFKTKNVATASIPATAAALAADTGGGRIVMGGGPGAAGDGYIPGGYAFKSAGNGLRLGVSAILYSGGGKVILRGKTSVTSHWQSGIAVLDNVTIKAGTGQIVLDGYATAGTTTNYSWNAVPKTPKPHMMIRCSYFSCGRAW
jgi:hypothetical protein